MACWCLAPIIAFLYALFDVNYFIRLAWTIGTGRLFQKKSKVMDGSTIYGLCTTNDVDIFIRHMNNARYIRELDFARFHYYDRCGIYSEIARLKATALQTASNIRYRKTIPIFTPYKITTKVVYWDDKSIYLEQQFVTVTDGFVRAVALSKQNIVGADVSEIMKSLVAGENVVKPPMPEELVHWLQAIEVSSSKLRKKD